MQMQNEHGGPLPSLRLDEEKKGVSDTELPKVVRQADQKNIADDIELRNTLIQED